VNLKGDEDPLIVILYRYRLTLGGALTEELEVLLEAVVDR
jgi:hypothetical protein